MDAEQNDLPNAVTRRARIAERLLQVEALRVADLTREFGVSDTIIRRDLTQLEQQGRLRRVRGGAVAHAGYRRSEALASRRQTRLEDKRRIGAAAASRVAAGEVLLFDGGTTTLQVMRHLPASLQNGNQLTVVTNALSILAEAQNWLSPNLSLIGGLYLPEYQTTAGPQAVAQLREMTADKAFLGIDGLTLEGGITTAHVLMAEMARAMAERARQVIVVSDSSKLGRAGFVPILPLPRVHTLITDTGAEAQFIAAVRSQGVEVMLV